MTLKLTDMCSMGRMVAGDGTVSTALSLAFRFLDLLKVSGCKNLILLYVPSLAVDVIGSLLSPDNCNLLTFCNGTADVLPSINNQVGAKQLEETNDKAQPLTVAEDASSQTAKVLHF